MANALERRWARGLPHHPLTIAFMELLSKHDDDDELDLKFGGDGDSGENLLFLMDEIIERTGRCPCCTRTEHMPVAPRDANPQYAVVRVPISEEDQVAASWRLWDKSGDAMKIPDMVELLLEPTLGFAIHKWRSAQKWEDLKLDEKRPRDDRGEHPMIVPVEGWHRCPPSPTKCCWYSHEMDPRHDSCVWCYEPETRK